MAYIGLKHPVFAPETTYVPGTGVTYSSGSVIDMACSCNLEITHADAKLNADDVVAETYNGATGGTIEFEFRHLPLADRKTLLGWRENKESTTITSYSETDQPGPYGGFGFIRTVQRNNAVIYEATWLHRVQFALSSEETNNKGENVEFQTAKVTGNILPIYPDATGVAVVRDVMEFDTYAAALTWLNASGRGNIT